MNHSSPKAGSGINQPRAGHGGDTPGNVRLPLEQSAGVIGVEQVHRAMLQGRLVLATDFLLPNLFPLLSLEVGEQPINLARVADPPPALA